MMRRIVGFHFALFVLACMSAPLLAQTALDTKAAAAKTFYVDAQAGSNQVSFSSQSTIEDFTGVCNKVSGQCQLDPKNLESFSGKFSVRVEDMRTGIDLRDTHMRSEDWLDATKHPEIVIDVKSASDVKKTNANTATMNLVGACTIRGKTNAITIPATLSYLDESPETQKKVKGDLFRLRSEFKVKLSDYGVTGPKGTDFIGLKVSDEIGLKVTIFGSTEPPPKELQADRPLPTATQPARPAPPKRPTTP
jgi:polyisoprenoid-binding protein YceI